MVGAILVALTFAALASGAQYGDYSGVKMPQYGGNADYDGPRDVPASSDEYHDHAPDEPAPLDYKYEEDLNVKSGKSLAKQVEETEDWQKPPKKQRRPTRPIDSNLETLDKYSPDEIVPKFKANHRFSKHRPRLKVRNSGREDGTGPKRPVNYVRIRDTELTDIDNKDDFHDDKEVDFEDDQSHFVSKETTMRVARRKPRDRYVPSRRAEEDLLRENERVSHQDNESERLGEYPSSNEARRRPMNMNRRPSQERYGGPPSEDEDMSKIKLRPGKLDHQNYPEYSEYYDMKRVNNIQDKLPSLIRRTTVARTIPTRRRMTTPELYEVLPLRRTGAFAPFPEMDTFEKTTTTTTTVTTTTSTTRATTTITPKMTTITSKEIKKILSLAEKSRLSILKKALRKESSRNETTTGKPPVLLQVTNKMHTVVIVEPPTVAEPWLRAREVSDDTPEQLDQVKRMMRHKLVANAKNIQELTDNWDEMVCDYVDLGLLKNAASIYCVSKFLTIVIFLLFFHSFIT